MKELKQLIRDKIDLELYLSHSDRKYAQEQRNGDVATEERPRRHERMERGDQRTVVDLKPTTAPTLSITYCTGCRWFYRAAYFGLELLTTFDNEINSITLIPSRPPDKGGQFTVAVDGTVIWDRAEKGRFPELKELKQFIRDQLALTKDLGHSDKRDSGEKVAAPVVVEIDDQNSEEARKFFGVA